MLGAVHRKSPWVTMSFVDSGYQGDEAQRAAYEASRISITVVKRTDTTVKGFIVLPKRWVVERTLGWINRARRLSKDFEATIESSLAWLQLALASSSSEGLRGKARPSEFRVGSEVAEWFIRLRLNVDCYFSKLACPLIRRSQLGNSPPKQSTRTMASGSPSHGLISPSSTDDLSKGDNSGGIREARDRSGKPRLRQLLRAHSKFRWPRFSAQSFG